jgi:GNAT superfamily N-acetyltransferase
LAITDAVTTARPAERRDLPALSALADAQARQRQALDTRLASGPQVTPFLSNELTVGHVYGARNHATYVALRDGQIVGGVNIHKVEQSDRDPFATYYPRRFTSIGLLVAPDAPALAALLSRVREQATRWRTPALLVHNASSDRALHELLFNAGFRTYYHYALRAPPQQAGAFVATPVLREPQPVALSAPLPVEIRVRRASRADLDTVVHLGMESVHYHASIELSMLVPREESKKMRKRFEAILDAPQESTIIIAERARQIVGFYSLYIQAIDNTWTPPLFAPGRYGLIAEVSVDKGERRKGVGHRLFSAAEQWFRERGAHHIWLIYLPANPLSSKFWQSRAFVPVWEVLLKDEA